METTNNVKTAGTAGPEAGNLNQTFPLPADGELSLGGKTYRFCSHCHTPKPSAQIPSAGKNPGICVNCLNGINNYDKLVAAGLMAPRPGTKVVPVERVLVQRVVRA